MDKPLKTKDAASLPLIVLSDEILIEKKKRDELQIKIRKLHAEIKMHQEAHFKATQDELNANEN